jgi:hypothetical protein
MHFGNFTKSAGQKRGAVFGGTPVVASPFCSDGTALDGPPRRGRSTGKSPGHALTERPYRMRQEAIREQTTPCRMRKALPRDQTSPFRTRQLLPGNQTDGCRT